MPTHTASGEEVKKTAVKNLQKQYKKQEDGHKKYVVALEKVIARKLPFFPNVSHVIWRNRLLGPRVSSQVEAKGTTTGRWIGRQPMNIFPCLPLKYQCHQKQAIII